MESFDKENTNHLTCICERISTNEWHKIYILGSEEIVNIRRMQKKD